MAWRRRPVYKGSQSSQLRSPGLLCELRGCARGSRTQVILNKEHGNGYVNDEIESNIIVYIIHYILHHYCILQVKSLHRNHYSIYIYVYTYRML